ncbi:hypothetical protein SK128_018041 [Halocaridina rubra]|uniref:Uncharacterized protein n=1 Tax=Halocaridina rubra TaxID=373956 RepID=A0AAN9AAX5_HALRR
MITKSIRKSLENKKRWKQDPQRSKEILKERSLSSNTCIPHSSSREAFRNDPPVKEEGRALPAGGYWNEWLVSRNHEPEKKLSRRNWSKRSSSRCYENVSRLPSPSPSCPPSAEEERFTIPSQYHSLPQLHSCINKDSKCNRSIDYKSHASFIPYFTRDFGSITKMPKSQKYSHTSLIDQALESLEMSSSTVTGSHTVKSESFQVSPFDHWHEGLNLPLLSTGQIESSSTSTSSSSLLTPARSPILPPLPAGVLDNCPKIPEQNIASSDASPNTDNNLESVCILSLDVTVDCKEFTRDRFKVTNINNSSESEQEMDEENLRNASLPTPILSKTLNNENGRKEDDTKSGRNSVLSIEEKYYENDDYETTEDTECNILRDEEQSQLDASIALLTTPLSTASTSTDSEKANSATGNNDDEDDFIDIDCDVKPMEALKRPLVYGYGSRPIHSLQGSSFLERRLSSASDASEYMEMDIAETLSTGKVEDVQYQKSESCMNLRETYWDYWQAKQASSKMSSNRSSLCGDYSSIESPVAATCPSQRFCYDPEVLLAHVRCPKSLEDATFKQYSAYVKSHIYDYFGDVKETLKDYGLENNHYNWISSQPELLPQTSNHQPFSKPTALDYSSEPELSYNDESIYLRGKASYKYPTLTPPSRRPPPLCKKNRSQDSGTWTYLQSSQESAPGFNAKDVYPVPLPRSTSSLSHIGPNLYNPWTHLLPDVTPPRTPRHSINYTTTVLPEAKTVSPSSCRKSLPKSPKESTAYIVNSKLTQKSGRSYVNKQSNSSSPKRSLLPNLSKVVKSPLKMQVFRSRAPEIEDSLDIVPDLPRVHPSIQTRTHTTTSSKSSSSSSSSSSASSKDSVTTVIPATARTKGSNWLLRHFGGAKSKMTAV